MSQLRQINKAIRFTIALWLLTALLYPLVMLGFGQIILPVQANGSLLTNPQGTVIGSALIGQPFTSDRYFFSRPSTIDFARVAADYHITQIVIGESQQSQWKRWLKGSFTQKLMDLIRHQNIDLHIIATEN